jgi:ketosteroid isomerase-like protein
MTDKNKAKEEIRTLLQKISEAWFKGDPDDLMQYFHEDLVIMSPDLQRMGEGKTACIQSYKDFIAQAVIHEYKEYDYTIDVWGDTAVSTYAFDMTYEIKGQMTRETGHDIFVYNREGKKWLVVWRMVIPAPSEGS